MKVFTHILHLLLLWCVSYHPAFAESSSLEKLVIISPHRKSIQDEFVPSFEKYYKEKYQREIKVEWLDQGGTENNVRYVVSKYKSTPQASGIDIFWGGGDVIFTDMENQGLLEAYPLPEPLRKEIPLRAAGVDLCSKANKWYATALSSFGIFYNKPLLARLKLPEPRSWEDLADPRYYDLISVADPRHSATSLFMQMLILYSDGWEKGWKTLAGMAGNTRNFTHSSSDPIKAVVSGDVAIATAIDFYAYAKIAELGSNALGFVLPEGKTVVNADPIAILKGAANSLQAQRFIEYLLSAPVQKRYILPKGHKEGPQIADLGRMAVNPLAYSSLADPRIIVTSNPFTMAEPKFQVDIAKLSKVDRLLGDLFGAVQVDNHRAYKQVWALLQKTKGSEKLQQDFVAPPLAETEMWSFAEKWGDNMLRNKTINGWIQSAEDRKQKVLKEAATLEARN
jgi:ABC-type Fe3+ transport system substrate-binding protein